MQIKTLSETIEMAKELKEGQTLVIVDVDGTVIGALDASGRPISTKQAALDMLTEGKGVPKELTEGLKTPMARMDASMVVDEKGLAAYWYEKVLGKPYDYSCENPVLDAYDGVYRKTDRLAPLASLQSLKGLIENPNVVVVFATTVAVFDKDGNTVADQTAQKRAEMGPVMEAAIVGQYRGVNLDSTTLVLTSGFGEKNKIAEAAADAGRDVDIVEDSAGAIRKRLKLADAPVPEDGKIHGNIRLLAVGPPDKERGAAQQAAYTANPEKINVVYDTTVAFSKVSQRIRDKTYPTLKNVRVSMLM